jgi:hypothetical protein
MGVRKVIWRMLIFRQVIRTFSVSSKNKQKSLPDIINPILLLLLNTSLVKHVKLVHHAFVDWVFWRWQNVCEMYKTYFGGTRTDGSKADVSDQITGFPYFISDVLDAEGEFLCYRYDSAPTIPKPANGCPVVRTTTTSRPPGPTDGTTTTRTRTLSTNFAAVPTGNSTYWFQDMLSGLVPYNDLKFGAKNLQHSNNGGSSGGLVLGARAANESLEVTSSSTEITATATATVFEELEGLDSDDGDHMPMYVETTSPVSSLLNGTATATSAATETTTQTSISNSTATTTSTNTTTDSINSTLTPTASASAATHTFAPLPPAHPLRGKCSTDGSMILDLPSGGNVTVPEGFKPMVIKSERALAIRCEFNTVHEAYFPPSELRHQKTYKNTTITAAFFQTAKIWLIADTDDVPDYKSKPGWQEPDPSKKWHHLYPSCEAVCGSSMADMMGWVPSACKRSCNKMKEWVDIHNNDPELIEKAQMEEKEEEELRKKNEEEGGEVVHEEVVSSGNETVVDRKGDFTDVKAAAENLEDLGLTEEEAKSAR